MFASRVKPKLDTGERPGADGTVNAFRNFAIACLLAMNLFLGLGLYMMTADFPAAEAQADDRPPAEYLLIPISNNPNQSILAIINSQRRQMMLLSFENQQINLALQPTDLKSQFEAR